MAKLPAKARTWIKEYLRYVDYIGAAQLYLKENYFLEDPLKPEHIKERILGHWGTVPGLNLIYAAANYVIHKHKFEALFVNGPGHGAPAVLANLFADGTLKKYYKQYSVDGKGMGRLIKDFSWPHSPFPSHVTPTVPGSILEGGELGYSLSTAFGAVLDNPNLIAVAVVGDGEAETGPIAAAWHSNKFLNPKTCGAVLPIVHVNGYKISNPTIFGRMSDQEVEDLFRGYGYECMIVKGRQVEEKLIDTMEKAYKKIRSIQSKARKSKKAILKPKWPVIVLRTPKGWKGAEEIHGHDIEGSFHSHGVPIEKPRKDYEELKTLEKWLKSYKVHQLVDNNGRPKKELLEYVPTGKYRMGDNQHAIGGKMMKKLKLPAASKHTIKVNTKKRGAGDASSMINGGNYLRDIIKANKTNFRLMCPDEVMSNKLGAVFEVTGRAYMWPTEENDEYMDPNGRVMEILSEHSLQGWMQGYLLTGRHSIFVSYEAFVPIIASMVDQYAKFLKQAFRVSWRKPVPSAVYLLSSVGWRQDHNGYSHQNPSFVSGVLQKHGEFCQIYYPSDANSLIAAYEEVFTKRDSICVIVAGKRPLPQWLTMKEAREQAKKGIGIWDWVGGKTASKDPDVVLASAGDYITQEALLAVKMCKEVAPELKVRYVNVSELTSLCLGDNCSRKDVCTTESGVHAYLTKDKPVVFAYHGYVNDIEQILWPYATSHRFSLHGYHEEGSTTTPFDMKVANGVSCYHLAMDLLEQGAKNNAKLRKKLPKLKAALQHQIDHHQEYIREHGDDPKEVKNLRW